MLQPYTEEAFEGLKGDDLAWWKAQGEKRDLFVYEAVNFMDGKRTAAEIALALSCEFERDFDTAWVDRLVVLLEGLKLVTRR